MKKVERIQYKGSPVTIRRWYHKDIGGLRRKCFICREVVGDGDVALIANNYEHIPNMLVHSGCFDRWKGREKELCGEIEKGYLDWLEKNEIFGTTVERVKKEEEKTYTVIGECEVDQDGNILKLDRGWYRQGWVYKNEKAYYTDKSAVCYVPELEDAIYTGQDILDMCNGQPEIADRVFEAVDWQHPSSYLDEQGSDELCQCECGKWYWCYDVDKCPFCGAENPNDRNLWD